MLLAALKPEKSKVGDAATGAPCPSRRRPIDLVHLARQTCGDRALEADVLGMLGRQLDTLMRRLDGAREEDRRQIAHSLKGTARNVGAFRLADSAERYETALRDETALAQLRLEAEAVSSFARSLID